MDIYMRDDRRTCSTCGGKFSVLWPDLWAYKTQQVSGKRKWFCSWKCLQKAKKEEEERMARTGRPKKIQEERPEENGTVAAEEIEIRAEEPATLEVVTLKSRALPGAEWHKTADGRMMITIDSMGPMEKEQWTALAGEILQAIRQLEI